MYKNSFFQITMSDSGKKRKNSEITDKQVLHIYPTSNDVTVGIPMKVAEWEKFMKPFVEDGNMDTLRKRFIRNILNNDIIMDRSIDLVDFMAIPKAKYEEIICVPIWK